ncbi:hypothetical protein ARMSODRAFT_967837 [Armillaria solidipes]|uniref:Uncharacterized protein n=1 Tax=Armillaria solidipes TaxID=1076256 RepID=A0A2H3B160_9AGAR|nr:hypothetical protein ARMSODRAFT_967837 [Armillaria solidipes]
MFVYYCPASDELCCVLSEDASGTSMHSLQAQRLFEHKRVVNAYRSPTTLPSRADANNDLPSAVNTFAGDTTNVSFTPMPMSSYSPSSSYTYGDTVILVPTPPTVTQKDITQTDAHSHLEVENSYIVQYQEDNSSVIVQDSSARFGEDYLTATYNAGHGWAGREKIPSFLRFHHSSPATSSSFGGKSNAS